jgi:hypothetical protein
VARNRAFDFCQQVALVFFVHELESLLQMLLESQFS